LYTWGERQTAGQVTRGECLTWQLQIKRNTAPEERDKSELNGLKAVQCSAPGWLRFIDITYKKLQTIYLMLYKR